MKLDNINGWHILILLVVIALIILGFYFLSKLLFIVSAIGFIISLIYNIYIICNNKFDWQALGIFIICLIILLITNSIIGFFEKNEHGKWAIDWSTDVLDSSKELVKNPIINLINPSFPISNMTSISKPIFFFQFVIT